jgi:hypothetical protein
VLNWLIARAATRERRQFLRLVRLSLRRMQDAALASRDVDADQFVLWGAALLATPLFFTTMIWTSRYPWLRRRSLDLLHDAVIADRLFFVVWPMLVLWLVGALIWDGLFPDKTDQQVLGVLPVSARAVAGARLTAALIVGGTMVLAIVAPPAIVYGLFGAVHPSVGPLVGIIVGQALASLAAGLTAFAALLTLRGLLVALVGATTAARVAVGLQLVTVMLLFQTFMFLPGLLPAAMRALQDPAVAVWAPPAWFMGVYALFAGPRSDQLTPFAPMAFAALGLSLAGAAAVYLLPASLNARRVMEAVAPRKAWQPFSAIVSWMSRLLWTRSQRAIFAFAMASLLRSRRHLMTLATYLGLGLALAGTRLLSAKVRGRSLPLDEPFDYLLSMPLVLTFFLVLGVRSTFAVPTDLGANWIFRVAGPREAARHAPATSLACMAVAVFPVSLLVFVLGSALWGAGTATQVACMHAVSGVLLVVLVLAGQRAVPFTRANAVSPDSLKVVAPLGIVAVHLYAFRLDDLQRWSLRFDAGPLWYVAAMAAAAALVLLVGRWWYGRPATTFDAPADGAVTLSLSESSGV